MSMHRYSRNQRWLQSAAWKHLLAHKPRFEVDGLMFEPMDHHFRSRHGDDGWGWYVVCWRLLDVVDPLTLNPSRAPEPVELWEGQRGLVSVGYSWGSWLDHDNERLYGFILDNEVLYGSMGTTRVETVVIKRKVVIDHLNRNKARREQWDRLSEAIACEVNQHPDAPFEAKHNYDDAVSFLKERGITVDIVED